ncbi:MAG: ABC transporter ATP-binding protein [Oscillochloris sp.]|nr:ABC transporter ATP-binding protein [Oscillochloris sp.]
MIYWRSIIALARYRFGLYLLSGLFASSLFYLIPLLPGLIVQAFFDQLSGNAPAAPTLWGLAALLVGISIFRSTALIAASAVETSVNTLTSGLMRRNIFHHVLHRPGARALPNSPGEAVSRLRDDTDEVSHFVTWTLDPIGQLIMLITALTVLARINALATLTVVIPLILALIAVQQAARRIRAARQASRKSAGAIADLIGEIFGAALAVKAAGAEERVAAHMERLNLQRRHDALRDLLLTQGLNALTANAASIGVGLLLLLIAPRLGDGSFSVGDLALFVSYLGWLTNITSYFGNYLARYRQMTVSLERLQELMIDAAPAKLTAHSTPAQPIQPALAQAIPSSADLLRVEGLRCIYPESGGGIHAASFVIPAGALVVITGRIGAGKTTLLRAIQGLLPHQAGTIFWKGFQVADPANHFVPPHSAYVPQAPNLFSASLRDNLLLGEEPQQATLAAAIHTAVLERDIATLDDGLETLVGPRGVRLSGGQMQRSATARALVRRPELLIVDDLSSALDVATEAVLWERLAALRGAAGPQQLSVLAVAHRRAALRRADRIIVVQAGQVIDSGALDELLARCAELRLIWHGDAT